MNASLRSCLILLTMSILTIIITSAALAQASLERTLDGLATLVGWHECNHVGPVYEGDLLGFRHTAVAERLRDDGTRGRLRAIRVEAVAYREGDPVVVLDWTPVVLTS